MKNAVVVEIKENVRKYNVKNINLTEDKIPTHTVKLKGDLGNVRGAFPFNMSDIELLLSGVEDKYLLPIGVINLATIQISEKDKNIISSIIDKYLPGYDPSMSEDDIGELELEKENKQLSNKITLLESEINTLTKDEKQKPVDKKIINTKIKPSKKKEDKELEKAIRKQNSTK